MTAVRRHLARDEDHFDTPFSSWSPSLVLATWYARSLRNRGFDGVTIAMMDTRRCGGIEVFSVVDLYGPERRGPRPPDLPTSMGVPGFFDLEFLVYGRARPPGYVAVPWKEWLAVPGFHDVVMGADKASREEEAYGNETRFPWWLDGWAVLRAFSEEEMRAAVSVAAKYYEAADPAMAIYVGVATLNMRVRSMEEAAVQRGIAELVTAMMRAGFACDFQRVVDRSVVPEGITAETDGWADIVQTYRWMREFVRMCQS
jgi:hypothetical protein